MEELKIIINLVEYNAFEKENIEKLNQNGEEEENSIKEKWVTYTYSYRQYRRLQNCKNTNIQIMY